LTVAAKTRRKKLAVEKADVINIAGRRPWKRKAAF